jgi:hypothetical protein
MAANFTKFSTAETMFASPERSSEPELKEQTDSISRIDILCELLNAIPDFVMILNSNRQIVFGNKALADFASSQGCKCFFGLRPGELVSCQHALNAKSGCGTGEACKTCGAVLSILQGLEGKSANNDCRIIRITDKGIDPLDMRAWTRPFAWNNQTFCLLILTDISNEKRRQVLERIFFHDVLNTAGNIWSISELLNDDTMKIDEVKKDLRCASSQLIDEINCQRQLLAAENNELQVKMSKQDSLEFMDSVYRTFRNHEIAADKNIEIDKSSEDFEFISDATLIFRIVGNILKNSLEASKARQTVTLGCRKNENDFSFWCHNDSVMPDDVKLQIFQRSYSTKGKGRGIGTYSIKLLTEKYLKGKVSFVSEAGAGTVFTVCFKCAP